MERLTFDTGVREYDINGTSILRMNPSDPNLYARLIDAVDEIAAMESDYVAQAEQVTASADNNTGKAAVRLMREVDTKAKTILNKAFGNGNDFDQIFGGVNIIARRRVGGRVLDAFLEAVMPILQDGIREFIAEDEKAIERYAGDYK